MLVSDSDGSLQACGWYNCPALVEAAEVDGTLARHAGLFCPFVSWGVRLLFSPTLPHHRQPHLGVCIQLLQGLIPFVVRCKRAVVLNCMRESQLSNALAQKTQASCHDARWLSGCLLYKKNCGQCSKEEGADMLPGPACNLFVQQSSCARGQWHLGLTWDAPSPCSFTVCWFT